MTIGSRILYSLIFLSMLSFFSCGTTNKVSYFQELDSSEKLIDSLSNEVFKIRIGDALSITVLSIDPATTGIFNLPITSIMPVGVAEISQLQSLQSYYVDNQGMINFPVLGKIKVSELTRNECSQMLETKIAQYVKDPIVNVQLLNLTITVLGEVTHPGTYPITKDRISILDAIGLAGDLTIYGKRENVLLIRDNNGQKEFYRFDLNRPDLFSAPYYYLQQNDVVYVEPNRAKQKNSKFSQGDSFNISMFSAVVSSLSVITSLIIALLVK